MLVQSEKVCKRLAGMFEFTECIDDRNAGVSRHLLDDAMTKGTQHDQIDPTFEIVGNVVERLAGIEATGGLIYKKRAAAQAVHAGFKGETSAQRGLLKEHHHLFAGEHAAEIRRPLFEH